MSSDLQTVAALGRPFTLGTLYDARKDQLVPDFTLWEAAAIQKNTIQSANHGSGFEVTVSDSMESRWSLLDIETSLKVSLFAGLVEVGGSALFLNDQKPSRNGSRVTCRYHATTHLKQLAVPALGPPDPQLMETARTGSATHVATGIQYGANAFFVFDSEKMEEGHVWEVQSSMEAVAKKIPAFNVGGEAEIKLTDEEKALTNRFTCKFYGDLEGNPATFEEAVRTLVELPKLLGPNGEKAAPLKVWLLPLKRLDSKVDVSDISVDLVREVGDTLEDARRQSASQPTTDLSLGLTRKIQEALQDARQVAMRCNEALADRVVKTLPGMAEAWSRFQTLWDSYTASLRQEVARELPAVREGARDESALLKLLQDGEQSPFSYNRLSSWLDYKERELAVVRSCLDMMRGTNARVVHSRSQLERETLAPGVTDAVCFVFTSLETSDSVLDEMSQYLRSPLPARTPEEPRYFSSATIVIMRLKARVFSDAAKALRSSGGVKFFLMVSPNERYRGASIYHYKDGVLLTEDFSKPEVLSVEKLTNKGTLMRCKFFLEKWMRRLKELLMRFDVIHVGALFCCVSLTFYLLSTLFV